MIGRHSDLPLDSDPASRFLPWLIALMVFLSALALAGAFTLGGVMERWDRDVSGTLTVQIAPPDEKGAKAERLLAERSATAVRLLEQTPGVIAARPLGKDQLVALIEPWLGSGDILQDMPLPLLIDVTVTPGADLDVAALAERLARAVPGASLDDHRVWLSRLIELSRTIRFLALATVMLIGIVTAATIVYATRAGMAVFGEVIQVLHLVGAQDSYVAKQFADRALTLAFRGGAAGLVLAVPTLAGLAWVAGDVQGGFVPDLRLPLWSWFAILSLPGLAALLAMATARFTVHRVLRSVS